MEISFALCLTLVGPLDTAIENGRKFNVDTRGKLDELQEAFGAKNWALCGEIVGAILVICVGFAGLGPALAVAEPMRVGEKVATALGFATSALDGAKDQTL
jgi:hypothetical protein